jgi:hypothetical protein
LNPLNFLFSDPKRHWLNGRRLFRPDLMGATDPIVYQVYLYLVQQMTGGYPLLIGVACGLLSVATAWAFYRAAREVGMDKTRALLFFAVLTWMPSLMVIFHYFMMETVLLFLVAMALWMSGRYLRKRTGAAFLIATVIWTLAVLTKASVAPLAGIAVGYLWWIGRPRIRDASISIGVVILLMIPNALRTEKYLGFPAPLGSGWIPMIQHQSGARTIRIQWNAGRWQFSSPSCYAAPLAPLSSWMISRAYVDSYTDVVANSRNGESDWKAAHEKTRPGWRLWLKEEWENAILLFFAPSWPDSNTGMLDGWLNYWSRWIWGPVIFYVLAGNWVQFRQKRLDLIPLLTMGLFAFLLFQPFVTMEGRYRKPLEPLLLLNLFWLRGVSSRDANQSRGILVDA